MGFACALQYLADIDAAYGQRQQAYRREHRITAADIFRQLKGDVTFAHGFLMQRPAMPVSNSINVLRGFVAVFFPQEGFEHIENDHGFQRAAGFGDDADRHLFISQNVHKLPIINAAQVVSRKINAGRSLPLGMVFIVKG